MKNLHNNLLSALPRTAFALLQPRLKEVRAEVGTILHEQGADVTLTYFPCGQSLVSFEVLLEDGKDVETVLIGREGAVGGVVSHGQLPAYTRTSVQFPGIFLRIDAAELEKTKGQSPDVKDLLGRYSDCLMAQLFQSAACNAAHTIEQRTASWLLSAHDRIGIDEIPWTHEQLSTMLGVGRSYMSRVLQKLKRKGILETRRGVLCLRDPEKLHAVGCGCHDAVSTHFDTVLKGVYPDPPTPQAQTAA